MPEQASLMSVTAGVSQNTMNMMGLDGKFFESEDLYQKVLSLVRAQNSERTYDALQAVKKNIDLLRSVNNGLNAVKTALGNFDSDKKNEIPGYEFEVNGKTYSSSKGGTKIPKEKEDLEKVKEAIDKQSQELQLVQQQLLAILQDALGKESSFTNLQATINKDYKDMRDSVIQKTA
jgi:hypothetical protein